MKNFSLIALFLMVCLTNASAQQNIFVNQIGYETEATKLVYTDYKVDSFSVINVQAKDTLGMFPFALKKTEDPSTGKTVYIGDFSSIKKTGEYIVKVYSPLNSGITSYPFQIGEGVYLPLISSAHTSLYLQRCGMELKEQYASEYARPTCHLDSAIYHPTCENEGKREVSGGWHDAGDFGKYVAPGSVTVAVLLNLYVLEGASSTDDNWNIPESNNGIPDLLDEVKYELDWMLKMQRTDGAVHEKIHTKNYVDFIMPHEGNVPQYVYQVSSTATADFAATMAMASRIYRKFNADFAEKCLTAALKSYNYLEKHPDIFPEGGFKNPKDTKAGGYSDAYDLDERIWAAAELYVTTGKKKYRKDFDALFQKINQFSSISWVNPSSLGFYSILLHPTTQHEDLRKSLTQKLIDYCEKHIEIAKADGFGVAMGARDYSWGSNGTVVSRAMNYILAHKLTKEQNYKNLASQHMHYILGMNANKKCFVTGFGSNPVRHLHHAPSVADGILAPIPGILTGGPNRFKNDQSLVNTFKNDTPPALVYLDNEESYSSNENTIYTNAYMVFVLSLL